MRSHIFAITSVRSKALAVFIVLTGIINYSKAQAPTSLTYPNPNVFIANVSNVYLAPSVAGNVTGYSISPGLPSGLTFNTNTGVISGIPTAASALTSYTITATGGTPVGSVTDVITIQVTTSFNNIYNNINFGGPGVTIVHKVGTGTVVGDITLYQNVTTLSGQPIDAIVRTTSLVNAPFVAYDQNAASGSGFSANQPRFFSPQFSLTGAGSAGFDFQFILGGTYNNTTTNGLTVVLQNVQINSYDIDGNGSVNSNQYNEFGGFDSSDLGSPSVVTPTYDPVTGLTKFRSNINANVNVVTDDSTRVRVTYINISDFSIVVGAGASGASFFFLDFGAGPAFTTAVTTATPSIDLNTSTAGVNNALSGCGSSLAFSAAAQTNISNNSATLDELTVSFATTDILDGSSEELLVNGASSGGNISLDFSDAAPITNVVLGGITYKVNATVSGGVSELLFTNNAGGTFTLTQAEALLDALRYNNEAATPTAANKTFTVNVRTGVFVSPDARFVATLNCVSISGNIFHDNNAMQDSLVNASGTQLGANGAYAILADPSNNHVLNSSPIAAGGAFSFGAVLPGTYVLYISNTSLLAGTVVTTATYPAGGYVSTGENLGTGQGNDLLVDGKLMVTIGSGTIADANFGIEIPPVTASSVTSSKPNPGGFNGFTIPAGSITASDADGTVDSLTITEFPSGANYIRIGNTVYTNPSGGICPPQSTCTVWPGTVTIAFSGNNTVLPVSIDPSSDAASSVVIKFFVLDNGNFPSNVSTLTVPFAITNYKAISGNVWHDINGNGLMDVAELPTNVAGSGETLFAVLVQNNNTYSGTSTVFATSAVNLLGMYGFAGIPSGSDYSIRLVSSASAPVNGSDATGVAPKLAPSWVGVSTDSSGTVSAHLNTNNPLIALNNLAQSQSNLNFGLERIATADVKSYAGVNELSGGPFSVVSINNTQDNSITYVRSLTLAGNASTGTVPGMLTGDDPDGGIGGTNLHIQSGTTGVSLVIDPSSYTNSGGLSQHPTMLTYNGVQLQAGGCQGSNIGDPVCDNYNSVTGFWEIPDYNVNLLKVLVTMNTASFGFSYALKDGALATGAFVTYTVGFNGPLPLSLVSFLAQNDGNAVTLKWTTANEENFDHFDIQRSTDGVKFTSIGTVEAGSQASVNNYSFVNTADAGNNYYRLVVNDKNGNQQYSAIKLIIITKKAGITIYPNPVTSKFRITVTGHSVASLKAAVTIFDGTGRRIYSGKLNAAGQAIISANSWPSGVYNVVISDAQYRKSARLVVK